MAKLYGDLPCTKLMDGIHLTISGTRLACGGTWQYSRPSRTYHKCVNIIWRDKAAITCPDCLAYLENLDKSSQSK